MIHRKLDFGFTLIELLVVISLIALLLGYSIPAYNNYNKAQQLVQSGSLLAQAFHQAQNGAISGAGASGCATNTFDGWYVKIAPGTPPTVSVSGSCNGASGLQTDVGAKQVLQFPSNTVSLALNPNTSSVWILFQPVSQQALFFKGTNFADTCGNFVGGCGSPATSMTMTLKQATSSPAPSGAPSYVITVTSNGSVQTNQ